MGDQVFAPDDPRADDVQSLLAQHLDFSGRHGPSEDNHALDVASLAEGQVSFFSIRAAGELLGVGALQHLDAGHAEIKSMHIAAAARRRGVGRALLDGLLGAARAAGYERVSLETGSMEAFAPARALYLAAGFEECGPFAHYRASPNNVYMTLVLGES